MDCSALMEPITGQSDAVRTATFNPLLCQECQYLNDPSTTASHISGYASTSSPDLEELSQKLNCIVCEAVSKAVEAQRKGFRILKDLPASRIFVRNDGPSFLEDRYLTPDDRYDTRDSRKVVIRAIMNLSITVLTVEERWLEIEMRIEELRDRNSVPDTSICMPNTAGKYMPGEWRSTRMWQTCPQSPWQALARKNLDAAACDIATGLPGSLVFNTTVASLRLHLDEGDMSKEQAQMVRHVAICAGDGERIGFLYTMVQESQKYYDFIVICGGITDFSARKAMVSPRLWGGEPDYDSWRLYVMFVERLAFESFVAHWIDVGYVYAHKWHTCSPS